MHLKISAEFETVPYHITTEPVQVIIVVESYGKSIGYGATVPMEYLVNNSMMDMFFDKIKSKLIEMLKTT